MSIFVNPKKTPGVPGIKATESGAASPSPGLGELRTRGEKSSLRLERPTSRASRDITREDSTLNPHLAFEGNLRYAGQLTVDCQFRGSIATDGKLLVGPAAEVEADIAAGHVEVFGKVYGNIKATKNVKIQTGGQVFGNIETPTISMEEGVIFEGNCSRPAEEPNPVTAPSPSASRNAPEPASSTDAIDAKHD